MHGLRAALQELEHPGFPIAGGGLVSKLDADSLPAAEPATASLFIALIETSSNSSPRQAQFRAAPPLNGAAILPQSD